MYRTPNCEINEAENTIVYKGDCSAYHLGQSLCCKGTWHVYDVTCFTRYNEQWPS